ncbi:hypothetical protein ACMD2_17618 [Ananas comosus]|uniref:DUF8040 domain-containing protein n=1 Tax=Ananas comosus TaxID=4615 RepID=A0A199UPD1_ANACO|nr:hypothetical protein ACMD2_17618 [Ananas comosus]
MTGERRWVPVKPRLTSQSRIVRSIHYTYPRSSAGQLRLPLPEVLRRPSLDRVTTATQNRLMAGAIIRQTFSSPLVANLMTFLDEEEDYWEKVHALLIEERDFSFRSTIYKQPCRTRPFTSHQLIHDILSGHPNRGYQHFMMTTTMFIRLQDELVEKGCIQSTRHLTADE